MKRGNLVKVLVGLLQSSALGGNLPVQQGEESKSQNTVDKRGAEVEKVTHIAVMEAVVGNPKLLEELKVNLDPGNGILNGIPRCRT